MAAFFRFYQKSFDNRPIITLICANASLNALGDVVAQTSQMTLTRRDPDNIETIEYDPLRTVRFAAFGAVMGPLIGRWAKFLEHRFPLHSSRTAGKASLSAVAKRVTSDQFVMAPIGLAIFLGSMGVMEGRSASEIKHKYTALFGPALLANWTVWPFTQMLNFRYMPLAYRVPFQSTCGVFWTLYLSLLNSSENKSIAIQDGFEKKDRESRTVYATRVFHDSAYDDQTWDEVRGHAHQH